MNADNRAVCSGMSSDSETEKLLEMPMQLDA